MLVDNPDFPVQNAERLTNIIMEFKERSCESSKEIYLKAIACKTKKEQDDVLKKKGLRMVEVNKEISALQLLTELSRTHSGILERVMSIKHYHGIGYTDIIMVFFPTTSGNCSRRYSKSEGVNWNLR